MSVRAFWGLMIDVGGTSRRQVIQGLNKKSSSASQRKYDNKQHSPVESASVPALNSIHKGLKPGSQINPFLSRLFLGSVYHRYGKKVGH